MLCVGKKNYDKCLDTTWYGFSDKPISQDTRCEYCYNKMKELNLADTSTRFMYKLVTPSNMIDCDTLSDDSVSAMEYKGFLFKVLNNTQDTPYLVHTPKSNNRLNGVYVVEMPETTDYCIVIDNEKSNRFTDSNIYYTFEMSVGDKKVVINNGQKIYYNGRVVVSGFETGKNNNFIFVANKPGVSQESSNQDPNSNIITIKVNLYYRKYKNTVSYSSRCGLEFGSGRGGIPEYRGSAGRSNSSSTQGRKKYSKKGAASGKSLGSTNQHREEEDTETCTDLFSDNPSYGATSSVFNGRTEQGNKYVDKVNTVSTEDTFELYDGFTAIIQLIHVDSKNSIESKLEKIKKEQDNLLEQQRMLLLDKNKLINEVPPAAAPSTSFNSTLTTAPTAQPYFEIVCKCCNRQLLEVKCPCTSNTDSSGIGEEEKHEQKDTVVPVVTPTPTPVPTPTPTPMPKETSPSASENNTDTVAPVSTPASASDTEIDTTAPVSTSDQPTRKDSLYDDYETL